MQFKKDHPSVAELMGKGILAVGFPDSSYVESETELSERVEADKSNLRQLIYSCDETVTIPQPSQNENRQSPQNESRQPPQNESSQPPQNESSQPPQNKNSQPPQNESSQPPQNVNRQHLCCSIL